LLRGKDPEISSLKFEALVRLEKKNCCEWLLGFTCCLNNAIVLVCSFRIFSGQKTMHNSCEPESEALVGFTCAELLAN
jgi:hypothetical protein